MVKDEQKSTNLSNSIVSAIGQYSNKKTATAAYDKTYVSSIIGVNREFSSEFDSIKDNIINSLRIPEDEDRGLINYYSFRLNNSVGYNASEGSYGVYCVKSEQRFSLNQDILVYVPNNNWSEMYISHLTNESRNIFYSAEAPEKGIMKGDLWIRVDNDKNILALYECVYYDEADYEPSSGDITEEAVSADDYTEAAQTPKYGWKLCGQDKDQSFYPKLFVSETDPCIGAELPDVEWEADDYLASVDEDENLVALYCVRDIDEPSDDGTGIKIKWKKIDPDYVVMGTKEERINGNFPVGTYFVEKSQGNTTGIFIRKETVPGIKWAYPNSDGLCYVYNYDPALSSYTKDGNLWIKTDGGAKAETLYERVGGEWVFKCSFGGGSISYIVSPTEPVIPEASDGDYWAEYSITYDDSNVVNTFVSLYTYNNGWGIILAMSDTKLPSTKDIDAGTMFVLCETNGIPTAVYRFDKSSEGTGEWTKLVEVSSDPGNNTGNNSGEESNNPKLYVYPYKVAEDGDLWFEVDDYEDRIAANVYENKGGEWKFLCKIKGEYKGVGEWLDDAHTIERFNDYSNYDSETGTGGNWSISRYSHVEGQENHDIAGGGSHNHLEGYYNTAKGSCFALHLEGDHNTATSTNTSLVGGAYNNVINALQSIIYGLEHTVTKSSGTIVSGYKNNVNTGSPGSIICGMNNIDYNGSACIVLGEKNINAGAHYTLIAGYDNLASGSNAIVCGHGATAGAGLVIVAGAGSSSNRANCFTVNDYGDVTGRAFNTSGADYAEMYEWLDGNPDNEDRRGLFVTLDGEYIRIANADDDYILGAVSATPSVVGDAHDLGWKGKYKRDIFGAAIYNEKNEPVLSDDFDPGREYIPQSERAEKTAVGSHGKLVVIDDGSCVVNGYCKHTDGGIATRSDDIHDYRVIRRIDENHIRIVLK